MSDINTYHDWVIGSVEAMLQICEDSTHQKIPMSDSSLDRLYYVMEQLLIIVERQKNLPR